jgi:hypothetical protein
MPPEAYDTQKPGLTILQEVFLKVVEVVTV